jgi:hypothetical protein
VYTNTAKELDDKLEVDENGDPLYVQVYNPETEQMENTAQRLVTKGLKSVFIAQAKDNANKALAATDWYVIRKAERGTDIPETIAAERETIIADCEAKEAAITAATTVDELAQVI